jgi:DNA-binding NarL/FixJ family response regulator
MRRFGSVLAMLDRLGIGVLIVREQSEIIVANQEAERILDAKDGVRRDARARLVADDAASAAQLGAAVRRALRAARLEAKDGCRTIELPRRTGAEPYLVDVVPFRDEGDEMGAVFSGVLLLLIDPDHREMISIQGLSESYGLTPTETLVCRMITQGMTLREIADARRVGLDTVKSQSRAIYTKTQTRNRRGLVRRALSIVPPLLDRDGRRIP